MNFSTQWVKDFFNSTYPCDQIDKDSRVGCMGLNFQSQVGRIVNVIDITSQVAQFAGKIGKEIGLSVIGTAFVILQLMVSIGGILLSPFCCCAEGIADINICPNLQNAFSCIGEIIIVASLTVVFIGYEVFKTTFYVGCDAAGILLPNVGQELRRGTQEAKKKITSNVKPSVGLARTHSSGQLLSPRGPSGSPTAFATQVFTPPDQASSFIFKASYYLTFGEERIIERIRTAVVQALFRIEIRNLWEAISGPASIDQVAIG